MRFILLLISALVAVFAGMAAMQFAAPKQAPTSTPAATQDVSTVDILVARVAIPAGTVITASMFDKQPWPQPLVLDSFIVSNGNNTTIIGRVARASFQAREPLIASKLSDETNTGFLAASLPAGMRAITIATDTMSGVAGFVFPGDRIDILFIHDVPHELKNNAANRPGYAEILAADIPVLAINLREAMKDDTGRPNMGAAITPTSMTIEVSELQAEQIRLAEKIGILSVALRSVNDRDNTEIAPPADLFSLTKVSKKEAAIEEDSSVLIVRGGDYAAKPQAIQGTEK